MRAACAFLLILATLLSGCYTKPVVVQAIDSRAIEAVQVEIKRQVGVYLKKAKEPVQVTDVDGKKVTLMPDSFLCGRGLIGFDISTIKAELTVTIENITDTKAGLSIPVRVVTLGPSLEEKRDVTNTEVLDYNLWLAPTEQSNLGGEVTDEDLASAPIARALIALRDALVRSALKVDYSVPEGDKRRHRTSQPCFAVFNPDKPSADAGNAYKIGLSILHDQIKGLTIGVSIVSVGSSSETKSTTGNSLTVIFVQQNMQALQRARDAVDAECKYPQILSDGCKAANDVVDAQCKYPLGLSDECKAANAIVDASCKGVRASSEKCTEAREAANATCPGQSNQCGWAKAAADSKCLNSAPSSKCKAARAAYIELLQGDTGIAIQ